MFLVLSNGEGSMKAKKTAVLSSAALTAFFLSGSLATAQQKTPTALRQPTGVAANDTIIQGTVVSYTANSTVAPLGAHVVVQTSSGTIDVHLGKAALLSQNHFSLAPGDTVRIAGFDAPFGDRTIFAARVLQKGNQAVMLRNPQGIPLAEGQSRAAARAAGVKAQGVVQ
jgi:endonuclease YncB( thermonuclease family)